MAEAMVGQVGVGKRAMSLASAMQTRFVALPSRRRKSLTGAGIGLLAVMLLVGWWMGRTDWRILFSGLETRDLQQVAQELGAAGIPFQTTADGVEVPAELLDKARMEVAAKGMPQTGRLGFELFDKPNWVGSEFDEKVNYQRALEGELEHTIGTLGVVRSARVHLVLPKESLFAAEERPAKASVVLKLKRSSLAPEQVDSIRNLVAGAVENLSPEQVTLVDADGRVNLQAREGLAAGDAGDAEQALEAKLVAMLEPLAGVGNVRATVNVSYTEGSEERTDEVYDPAGTVTLSSQKTEQVSGGAGRTASGVPGTASNTPSAAPVGAVQGSAAAAAPGVPPLLEKTALPVYPQAGVGGGQTTKQENGTYAVTRHVTHTQNGPGRLRRVTAAVVVNDRVSTEGAGKAEHTVWKPRTAEEMKRLEGLAQAAVGFDEKRGDQVVLENVGFSSNAPEMKAAGMAKVLDEAKGLVGQQPGLLKTVMFGVVGIMVVLFVLRPVAGQVVATLKEPMLLAASGEGAVLEREIAPGGEAMPLASGAQESAGLAEPVSEEVAPRRPKRKAASSAVFEQVAEHIQREPALSTRLLEAWISSGKEGE